MSVQPMSEDEARAFVAEVRWQFAASVPEAPHWYTVQAWVPERAEDFDRFEALIKEAGFWEKWTAPEAVAQRYPSLAKVQRWRYLHLDGYDYWRSGAQGPGRMINRREAHSGPEPEGAGSGSTPAKSRAKRSPGGSTTALEQLSLLRWTPPCLDVE